MATREEIREEVWEILRNHRKQSEWSSVVLDVMSYLHSQGVVIKVDGELPDNPYGAGADKAWKRNDENSTTYKRWHGYNRCLEDMADRVAVEPLIKE